MKQPLIVKLIPIHMHLTKCGWNMCLTWGHNLRPFVTLNLSINLCLNFATWKNHEVNKKISMKMENWRHLCKMDILTLNMGRKSIVKSYFWNNPYKFCIKFYLKKLYAYLVLDLELIELFLTPDLSKINELNVIKSTWIFTKEQILFKNFPHFCGKCYPNSMLFFKVIINTNRDLFNSFIVKLLIF
jgi:hypothetical protein